MVAKTGNQCTREKRDRDLDSICMKTSLTSLKWWLKQVKLFIGLQVPSCLLKYMSTTFWYTSLHNIIGLHTKYFFSYPGSKNFSCFCSCKPLNNDIMAYPQDSQAPTFDTTFFSRNISILHITSKDPSRQLRSQKSWEDTTRLLNLGFIWTPLILCLM